MTRRRFPHWSWELPRRVSVLWSKGLALHCDHSWNADYWQQDTEHRSGPDFFARHWPGCRGLVYVRLGTSHGRDAAANLDLESFAANLHRLRGPIVLVSTDGDLSVPGDLPQVTSKAILDHPLLKAWFTQNWDGTAHPKLHPLPIGLDLHSRKSVWNPCGLWGQLGLGLIARLARPRRERAGVMLLDAHFQIMPKDRGERRHLRDLMAGRPQCHTLRGRLSRPAAWRQYASHRFVLCPAGQGLDTHRTWEVLLLGAIPIVQSNSLMPLYAGLPVAPVERWEEALDPAFRQRWLETYEGCAAPVWRALSVASWAERMRAFLSAPEIFQAET